VPLVHSKSKKAVGKNISELERTGKYPKKQAIAIALDVSRKAGAKIPKGKAKKSEGNSSPKRYGERG